MLVQNNIIWTSENKEIDDFVQEMQLKMEDCYDTVFEWIPYDQFGNIKKTGNNGLMTAYTAIWKNGPLLYNYYYDGYIRNSNKEVALKCLHNLQNPIEFLINEV
jgi:hypothetical protein